MVKMLPTDSYGRTPGVDVGGEPGIETELQERGNGVSTTEPDKMCHDVRRPNGQTFYKTARERLLTGRAYASRLNLLDLVFYCQLLEEAKRASFPAEMVSKIFPNVS